MATGPTEKDWQRTLVELLEMFGYTVEHTYPLLTKQGFWRTGSTLKGKPDLIAVRPPRLLAIECKVDRRKPRPEQVAVLSLYSRVPCARAWVLNDSADMAELQRWIRRPASAPAVFGFEPIESDAECRRVIRAASRRKPATR